MDREEQSSLVGAEGLAEILFRRVDEWLWIDEASVGSQDIDLSLFFLDFLIELIEITAFLHVSANRRDTVSNESGGHIEVVPPAAGEIHERTFPHKPLRAVASPRPLLPPVITATLPCNLGIILLPSDSKIPCQW